MLDLHAVFDEFDGEYGQFELVRNPRHPRPDICAFLMLHDLLGGRGEIVCFTGPDRIHLDVEPAELAMKATREFIRDLSWCGVRYDPTEDSLYMLTIV